MRKLFVFIGTRPYISWWERAPICLIYRPVSDKSVWSFDIGSAPWNVQIKQRAQRVTFMVEKVLLLSANFFCWLKTNKEFLFRNIIHGVFLLVSNVTCFWSLTIIYYFKVHSRQKKKEKKFFNFYDLPFECMKYIFCMLSCFVMQQENARCRNILGVFWEEKLQTYCMLINSQQVMRAEEKQKPNYRIAE